jgi:hypothetical protein
MKQITVNLFDLEIINDIVKENNIDTFVLKQESNSGIGYTTTMEFGFTLNDRDCTVSIPVTDQRNW